MKNKYKKGTLICLVDENGKGTNSSLWADRDLEVSKGDVFEIGTTKNYPLIKLQCMSNDPFPLIAREIE